MNDKTYFYYRYGTIWLVNNMVVDFQKYKRPAEVKRFLEAMLNEKLNDTGVTASMGAFLVELDDEVGVSNR